MMHRRFLGPLLVSFLAWPAVLPAQDPDATELGYEITPADSALAAAIEADARAGAAAVETFFDAPFPRSVLVRVFPDRATFDRHLREEWGMEETACWMVGGAEEDALVLLSPRVWREEACDHDPGDADHVRELIAHELVHVYHMQVNAADEFEGVEGLDWLVEGVATWASGQLDRAQMARAREAVAKGEVPASLADAWTGPYRYGVAGSLAAFVGERVGRPGRRALLEAMGLAEVLEAVGLSEAELLAEWEEWVRRNPMSEASS
jgi:hypothetical protein